MPKVFNVTADCKPDRHYIVNLDTRLAAFKSLVDGGAYFTINRARQYGKTTTLRMLFEYLSDIYLEQCILGSMNSLRTEVHLRKGGCSEWEDF